MGIEGRNIPLHHGGHGFIGSQAQPFTVPASLNGEWQSVFLPFNGFSYDHSDYTGDCSTKDPDGFQHRCCSKESADVCPTSKQLADISRFDLYAEGVEGQIQMEVKEIVATGSAPGLLVV